MYSLKARVGSWIMTLMLVQTIIIATGCETTEQTTLYSNMATVSFEDAANYPPTAKTLFRMGRILAAQKRYRRAEGAYRNCIARYPGYLPAYESLAELYLRQQQMTSAKNVLREGLEAAPESSILRNNLGMCELRLGDYEQALVEFKAAAKVSPDDVRILTNVAVTTALLSRYDEALTLYKEIVPTGQAHYNIGVISDSHNDHERAKQEFALARKNGVMQSP